MSRASAFAPTAVAGLLHEFRQSKSARSCLFALALAGLQSSPNGARGEIIRAQDMLHGIVTTRAQCAATPNTVWVTAYGQDFCVRYYISTVGGSTPRPVVMLQGDRFGDRDPATRQWKDPAEAKDIDTANLQNKADTFSAMARTTAILVGRIGIEGTSGNHADRHTLLELRLVNLALDAIKQRYGFEGFHLAGQSGGSLVVGGLIGLRPDIACAVAGSAPMTTWRARFTSQNPARSLISPIDSIPAALQNRSLRLYLVTDPADQTVPADTQASFAEAMRRAGRPIPEFFVESSDEEHHNVVAFTRIVMTACLNGNSDREIAAAVDNLSRRNAEINRQKGRTAAGTPQIAGAGGIKNDVFLHRPSVTMVPTAAPTPPAAPPTTATTGPGVTSSPALPAPAPGCLRKINLQAGVVMFRDVCAQEWAINTSSVSAQAATKVTCLTKEMLQDGVLLFKDACTNEWAMNPPLVGGGARAN